MQCMIAVPQPVNDSGLCSLAVLSVEMLYRLSDSQWQVISGF